MKSIAINIVLFLSLASVFTAGAEKRSEYWHQRVSLFEKLSVSPEDIVFVGNSITDGGEMSELLSDARVKNRGINSDDIDGVSERIESVLKGKPSKIFLLIGINDISHNLSVPAMIKKYDSLVKKIKNDSPSTKLYIQSVMPINNDFARYKNLIGKENTVTALNSALKDLASQNDCIYIDLWQCLADPATKKLNPELTNDGLHLTGEGYLRWASEIKKHVLE